MNCKITKVFPTLFDLFIEAIHLQIPWGSSDATSSLSIYRFPLSFHFIPGVHSGVLKKQKKKEKLKKLLINKVMTKDT